MQNKTLDFKFEIKQIDEDGTIEGYGAIFGNRDSYSDIIEKGSFINTLVEKPTDKIKMLWQHRASEPIGFWTEIKEDEKGLYCKGKLLLKLTQAKEVYEMLKAGLIDGLSIGYNTVKSKIEEGEDECIIRRITEVDLWEISVVTFPANSSANITSVKETSLIKKTPINSEEIDNNKKEEVKIIKESDKKSPIEKWELKEFDKFLKNSSLSNSDIKIFRKRYLELHSKKEEIKDEIKTEEKKIDESSKKTEDENETKSPEGINKEKKSPEGKNNATSPEEIEKKNIQMLQNILDILQNKQ